MTRPCHCDVLIIGGGPAGSTCARLLRQAGLDTVILDKAQFPRDKTCAGWITPPVLETLGIPPADYAHSRVLQPIRGFRTGLIGHKGVNNTNYRDTISYGIRRFEFDDYLLQRSGARLMLGETVHTIERHESGWRVNGRLETPMLIGAGGNFCPVAQHLGARGGRSEPKVLAQETEFLMTDVQRDDCRVQGTCPELYFCRDLKGYGWVFRKGEHLNIGLGREDQGHLGAQAIQFVEWLTAEGRIPSGIPRNLKGHAYVLYGHGRRRRMEDRVLLIGDAAGLAYTQSGEGIRPAIESGIIAARVVAEARGDYSRSRLQAYEDQLLDRFGPVRGDSPLSLPATLRTSIGGWLLGNHWFTRHVVLDNWFLHNREVPV